MSLPNVRRPALWPVLLSAHVLVAAVGVVWWVSSLGHEPAYGDTPEYWRLARTLDVDGWRSLAYPLILRSALWLPGDGLTRLALCLLQTASGFMATWQVVALLNQAVGRERRGIPLLAFVAFCSPLTLHFSLTVLPDSLAASTLLLGGAATLRLVLLGDFRGRVTATAIVGLAVAAALRPERPFFVAAILALAAAGSSFRQRWQAAGVCLAVLVTSVVPIYVINRWSQTAEVGRSRPVASERFFERVVGHRFGVVYGHMPTEAQSIISFDEARAADADFAKFAPLTKRLQKQGGDGVLWHSGLAGLRCCAVTVLGDIAGDLVEYVLSPVNWVKESFTAGGDGTTEWTNSRMAGGSRGLTRLFIIAWGFLFLVDVALTTSVLKKNGAGQALKILTALAAGCVVLSSLLAMTSALDAHIRYGLPIAMVWQIAAVWGAMGPWPLLVPVGPARPHVQPGLDPEPALPLACEDSSGEDLA